MAAASFPKENLRTEQKKARYFLGSRRLIILSKRIGLGAHRLQKLFVAFGASEPVEQKLQGFLRI